MCRCYGNLNRSTGFTTRVHVGSALMARELPCLIFQISARILKKAIVRYTEMGYPVRASYLIYIADAFTLNAGISDLELHLARPRRFEFMRNSLHPHVK